MLYRFDNPVFRCDAELRLCVLERGLELSPNPAARRGDVLDSQAEVPSVHPLPGLSGRPADHQHHGWWVYLDSEEGNRTWYTEERRWTNELDKAAENSESLLTETTDQLEK